MKTGKPNPEGIWVYGEKVGTHAQLIAFRKRLQDATERQAKAEPHSPEETPDELIYGLAGAGSRLDIDEGDYHGE